MNAYLDKSLHKKQYICISLYIVMKRFSFFLQLFLLGCKRPLKKTELSSVVMFYDTDDLNTKDDGYKDTTAELEQLLTDRYFLRRKTVEGLDDRYPNENGNLQIMQQIELNFYKYELLKKLTDTTISDVNKLKYIEEYDKQNAIPNSKYMSELFKGLLFSDW